MPSHRFDPRCQSVFALVPASFRHKLVGGLGTFVLVAAAIAPVQAASLTQWNFDPLVNELQLTVKDGTTPRYFLVANPARIVVDLPDTAVGEVSTHGNYAGAVRHIRVSQFQPGLTRIVMELAPDVALAPGQVKLQKVDAARWTLRPLLAPATGVSAPATHSSRRLPATTSVPLPVVRPDLPVASPLPVDSAAVMGDDVGRGGTPATAVPSASTPPSATIPLPNDAAGMMVNTAGAVAIAVPSPDAGSAVNPVTVPSPIAGRSPTLVVQPPKAALPQSVSTTGVTEPLSVLPQQTPLPVTPQVSLPSVAKVPHMPDGMPTSTTATTPMVRVPPLDQAVVSTTIPVGTPLPPATSPAEVPPQLVSRQQPGDRVPVNASVNLGADSLPSVLTNPGGTPTVTVPPLAAVEPVVRSPLPAGGSAVVAQSQPSVKQPSGDRPPTVQADSLPSVLTSSEMSPTVTVPPLFKNEPVTVTAPPVVTATPNPMVALPAVTSPAPTSPMVSVPPLPPDPPAASVLVPFPSSPDMPGQLPAVSTPQRVVDFGQPLPAVPVPAVPRSALPGFPGNPSVAYRPLPPNVLLPSGTTLNLRYPGEAALKLDTDSKQDVLLLQTEIRDVFGQVMFPQGSMVIGRFETTNVGTRFIAQAISVAGQTLPLSAQSERLDGNRQISDTALVRNTGIGVLAGGLIGGLAGANPGWSALGGAAAGAATSLLIAPKPATIQPGQIVPVRLTQDLQQL